MINFHIHYNVLIYILIHEDSFLTDYIYNYLYHEKLFLISEKKNKIFNDPVNLIMLKYKKLN